MPLKADERPATERPDAVADAPRHGFRARSESAIRATYTALGDRTAAERIYEAGSFRLRHPKGSPCQAVLVNTSGGLASGDRFDLDVTIGPQANVTLTSAAAEKIYRSDGAVAKTTVRLALETGSRAVWIPQETIVFDGARLERRFDVDLAHDAAFVAAEMVVFGRAAFGEHDISGHFRDSWRLRRAGRLIFADETRLEGRIGRALARGAVAQGCGAVALILMASPDASQRLACMRAAIEAIGKSPAVEGGASLKDGIIIARFVADKSEVLRQAVSHVLAVGGGIVVPRVWH